MLVGGDEAPAGILAAARATDRLTRSTERAEKALTGMGGAGSYASGPFSRLNRLQQQLTQARGSRNVSAQMDLEYLVAQQQKRVNRIANPPQPMNKWLQVLSTSRFGYGGSLGGIHPLVGRTLAAMGMGGPEGMAIAAAGVAAIAATKAIYDLASSASEAANSMERIRLSLGSSSSTTARLTGLAGAIGLSAGDVGGLSASINQRISEDGLARATAAGMGVFQMPRPFGSVDEGKNLLKIAEGLRAIGDEAEAIRRARLLGAEALLPLRNLSESTFSKLKMDAAIKGTIFDKDLAEKGAEFQAAASRVGGAVENILAVIGRPVMERVANFLNNMADGLERIADWLDKHRDFIEGMASGAEGAMPFGEVLPFLTGPGAKQAMDDHAQELRDNTQALREMQETYKSAYYGKGERMNRAIPEGVRGGEALRRMLAGGGMLLPQF